MSSPRMRSEGSRRRGVSTWKDGRHSRITRKASDWVAGAVLMIWRLFLFALD
jgi:hypothetical protein